MARVPTQELRISVTVPVPADLFDQAEILAALKDPIEALRVALPEDAKLEHSLVTPRGPRTKGV